MSVGSVGASLILWMLGLFLSFCGLFVWLELACIFPMSGGEKVYLEKAYPKPKYLTSIVFAVYALVLTSSSEFIKFPDPLASRFWLFDPRGMVRC